MWYLNLPGTQEEKNENTPEYKAPPHFQWSEQSIVPAGTFREKVLQYDNLQQTCLHSITATGFKLFAQI